MVEHWYYHGHQITSTELVQPVFGGVKLAYLPLHTFDSIPQGLTKTSKTSRAMPEATPPPTQEQVRKNGQQLGSSWLLGPPKKNMDGHMVTLLPSPRTALLDLQGSQALSLCRLCPRAHPLLHHQDLHQCGPHPCPCCLLRCDHRNPL